jgi:hypothetical protein
MPYIYKQQMFRAVGSCGRFLRIIKLTRVLVGILFCALYHPVQSFGAAVSSAYTLTLSWGDSSPDPEVTSYRVHYGTVSGNYTNVVVTGNVSTAMISGLVPGITYYFAITAVDTTGEESDFSNEISYTKKVPGVRLQIQTLADGKFMLILTGLVGHTYEIQATQDFSTWTVIGTGTLDASGSLNFTNHDAANFSRRFYRAHDAQSSAQELPLQLQIQLVAGGQFMLTVTGPPGQTFDIEATEDFAIWTVIDTGTLDASGSMNFTDENAANFPRRFYRAEKTQP